jgi:predicted RNA-binding Zn-ribbon protein involved in translation (DUF1610 family)
VLVATLDNILTLLDKWPRWKRMNEAPDRIDELIARIEHLEAALAKCPAEGCPFCGERALRLDRVRGPSAWWKCENCDKQVERPSDMAPTIKGRAGTFGRGR